jgi:leucyl aminopeptidase
MSPVVPVTRSALIHVDCASVDDPGAVAQAAGVEVSALGIPVLDTPDGPAVAPGVPDAIAVSVSQPAVPTVLDPARARQRGFTGKVGQTMSVWGVPGAQGSLGAGEPAVVFVGCGRVEAVDADTLRRAAGAVVRAAGQAGAVVLVVPAALADRAGSHRSAAQAAAEGAVLATYRFLSHKSETAGGAVEAFVVGGAGLDGPQLAEGTRRGIAVADAVCLARDLVNEPPSSMTPTRLAQAVVEHVGGRPGVAVEVWDEQRIADER